MPFVDVHKYTFCSLRKMNKMGMRLREQGRERAEREQNKELF